MNRSHKPTMRELAEAFAAAPQPPRPSGAPRPGGVNGAGQFFDPAGNRLTLTERVSLTEAAALVEQGAIVAFEGCGCGGGVGGCTATWTAGPSAAPKPRIVKGYGSPTWIDRWTGDGGDVVYLHGDVDWPPFTD